MKNVYWSVPAWRMRRQSSRPSIFGMVQSLMTMGGLCARKLVRPSSPSAVTITSCPSRPRVTVSHLREIGSSSAIRIFTGRAVANQRTTAVEREQVLRHYLHAPAQKGLLERGRLLQLFEQTLQAAFDRFDFDWTTGFWNGRRRPGGGRGGFGEFCEGRAGWRANRPLLLRIVFCRFGFSGNKPVLLTFHPSLVPLISPHAVLGTRFHDRDDLEEIAVANVSFDRGGRDEYFAFGHPDF